MLFLLLACASCQTQTDVIFITIDTLRLDHIGAYNSESVAHTPHIDALASESLIFTEVYSPMSVTGPSFVSLHTGMDPTKHGVTMNIFRGGKALAEHHDTIAEVFSDQGYATGAFVSGFTLHPYLGLNQGFDTYFSPEKQARIDGAVTARQSIEWLEKQKKSVFLWYHSYDPHGPLDGWLTAPIDTEGGPNLDRIPPYQRIGQVDDPKIYQQLYARAVEYADEQVGRIVDTLKKQDRYDDALIIFTSDHGESFTERELWFDHGTSTHEEQLHVPLLIKYPKGKRQERIAGLMGLKDVAPTVLSIMEISGLPNAEGKAFSVNKYVTGESSHCKNHAVLSCSPIGPKGKEFSVRSDDFTLIRKTTPPGIVYDLYDRKKDLEESTPITNPPDTNLNEIIDDLAKDRMKQVGNIIWKNKKKKKKLSEQEKLLRALGYTE